MRSARSSSSAATSTPKCSSAIDATLIAASVPSGAVSPIRTDVSSSARNRSVERIDDPRREPLKIGGDRPRHRGGPHGPQRWSLHPCAPLAGAEGRDLPSSNGDRELLAGLGPPE